jgi:hypothetical protein
MAVTPFEYSPDVFLERYWKRPEAKMQGDADGDSIFRAVGYALTNWE